MARDQRYDVVKGLAIILMVFGHAGVTDGVRNFIYLFHMPIFFLIAGWFYRRSVDVTALGRQIGKRFLRLWLPFVFWAGLAVVFHDWFIKIGIYTIGHFEDSAFARHGVFRYWGQEEILRQLALVPVFIGGCTGMGSPYWFFPTFFYSVFFYMISDFMVSRYLRKPLVVMTALALMAVALGKYVDIGPINYFTERLGGRQMLTGYFLVHLGRMLREYDLRIDRLQSRWQLATVTLATVVLLGMNQLGGIELVDNFFPSIWFLTLCSICGWILVTAVGGVKGMVMQSLGYVGRRTVPILFIHLYAFKLVSYAAIQLRGDPDYWLAKPFVCYRGWLWVAIYSMAGVLLPLIVDWIWQRLGLLRQKVG